MSAPAVESAGGLGGHLAVDPRTPGKDLRLYRAAVRWNVSAELRARILATMGEIIGGKGSLGIPSNDRERIAAARVVVAADGVDVRREGVEQAKKPGPTLNIQVNNFGSMTLAQLDKLSTDELLRIHKESLALPLTDQDSPASPP